ncbi:MAG: DMT family transporter [Synergistes sp.]|nr:DMT family transporter [Synergistes sp.]
MLRMKNSLKGILYIVAAGMCWGTTGTTQAFAPPEASSLSIGAARVALSGVIFVALLLIKKGPSAFRGFKGFWGVLLAGAGLAGYQLTFFTAVKLTGVSVGTMIAIGAAPPIAGLFGALLFHESLSLRWFGATAMAIAGCVMIVLGGAAGTLTLSIPGILLAAAAAFSYSLEGVGMRFIKSGPVEATALIVAASGVIAFPWLFSSDLGWILTIRGAFCITLLAVVSTILPYTLFVTGIKEVTLGTAYTLSLTEPLTAWFLSTVLLGERLSVVGVLGVAVLFCGLIILARDGGKK